MTAPTTPNAELAYKVLDHIDAHPEQWNQQTWFLETECGTSGCFAGWTVALAGHRIDVDPNPDSIGRRYYSAVDGNFVVPISDVAACDLGIEGRMTGCRLCSDCGFEEATSTALFDASNTREDLGRLVAEIFGPRPGGAS